MTVFFVKTILDWLSHWIVVGCLRDSCSVIVLNSALRYRTSWFANEIAINFTSHVDKATEFCFLDFHEIIWIFSAKLKKYLLTVFLSLKLAQSASQNPSNFKGFFDFLNIFVQSILTSIPWYIAMTTTKTVFPVPFWKCKIKFFFSNHYPMKLVNEWNVLFKINHSTKFCLQVIFHTFISYYFSLMYVLFLLLI